MRFTRKSRCLLRVRQIWKVRRVNDGQGCFATEFTVRTAAWLTIVPDRIGGPGDGECRDGMVVAAGGPWCRIPNVAPGDRRSIFAPFET